MTCRIFVLKRWHLIATAALIGMCSLWTVAFPTLQDNEEDRTRRLWDLRFKEWREPSRPKLRPPAGAGRLIGVTVWRIRETDENNQPGNLKEERARTDTFFSEGERVKLSIEVPEVTDSYLYVIDRELYADGKMSDPYLIFPSQVTPRDGNRLSAGKVIDVPAKSDPIPHFVLERTRKDLTSEVLTIIVSPSQLELPLGPPDDAPKLDRAKVAEWEKQWGARIRHREERGGAGKQRTGSEREAGEGTRRLRQRDPLPQTIYHIDRKPGDAIALNVPLRIVR